MQKIHQIRHDNIHIMFVLLFRPVSNIGRPDHLSMIWNCCLLYGNITGPGWWNTQTTMVGITGESQIF